MIRVEVSPTRLRAGRRAVLTVRLVNSASGTCNNLVFKVGLPREILLLRGNGRIEATRLGAGETVTGTIEVEPRAVGSYVLTSGNFSYRDPQGRARRVEDVRIDLEVLPGVTPDQPDRTTARREDRRQRSPVIVFFSYAREDQRYVTELDEAMAGMRHDRLVRTWYDQEILAGRYWAAEIDVAIDEADIFVPIVSASFLNSEYCTGHEWRRAQGAGEEGRFEHSAGDSAAFGLPLGCRPLSVPAQRWSDQYLQNADKAYLEIVNELRRLIRWHAGSYD